MNPFKADLHCHSTYSDGTFTPKQIIDLALEIDLKGLSITDHDTIAAYEEAIPYAKSRGIALITGAEFSAVQNETNIHILAYGFPFDSELIKEFSKIHAKRRLDRNRTILNKLNEKGMIITEDDLVISEKSGTIGRPHIAYALMKKGYVESIQQAFRLHIGEGKPCYVAGLKFGVEETIQLIHEAGGLAVIAHPHLISDPKALKTILEFDFDGIEAYYGRFSPQKNQRWIEIGNQKQWILTGGSDFHGEIKPNLPLGSSWVNEETFHRLEHRL